MTAAYELPLGVGLLFASRAVIDAAPAAEREAYYEIVEAIVTNPEDFGFRRETGADHEADDAADRRLADPDNEWRS